MADALSAPGGGDSRPGGGRGRLRPAAFLDRDGTVIQEAAYLADPEGVVLVPGAIDALRRLRAGGFAVVLVTNQSGIARGLYEEADYHAVARRLEEILAQADATPDGTYYCPHHPDFSGPCDCRKPAPGMYLQAARELGLDPGASYYVGDKLSDVEPAQALGGEGILVRTGYGSEVEASIPAGVTVVDDLPAAADHILRSGGRDGTEAGRGAREAGRGGPESVRGATDSG